MPRFGIWAGSNGDQSCLRPGHRMPIPANRAPMGDYVKELRLGAPDSKVTKGLLESSSSVGSRELGKLTASTPSAVWDVLADNSCDTLTAAHGKAFMARLNDRVDAGAKVSVANWTDSDNGTSGMFVVVHASKAKFATVFDVQVTKA